MLRSGNPMASLPSVGELHRVAQGWLSLESADTPMHMGVLAYLVPPDGMDAAQCAALLRTQWLQSEMAPRGPWTWVLRARALRGRRRWQPDSAFDLEYHFRASALPLPGGERELGELISRLHSQGLDLSRPLWECTLIEGLHGGRLALYLKIHPALVDGRDLLQAIRQIFSADSSDRAIAPWQWSLPQSTRSAGPSSSWLALWGPLQRRVRDVGLRALPWAGFRRAPRSALNTQIGSLRRFATQEYPCERLAAVGADVGASDEDILYYLCGSALRRFFREFNALPEAPLVAIIADRSRVDQQLCPLFISLGTQHASRRGRLREVRESLRVARGLIGARKSRQAAAEATVDVLPYMLRQLLGVDHRLPPLFNLGMAHFSEPPSALYCGPAGVESIYPMPMLLQGSALAIASLRYADKIQVGLTGARDTLPHLQRIAVYMENALRELEQEGFDND